VALTKNAVESRKAVVAAQAESDLETFIRLVAPKQLLGALHIELCTWMTRQEKKKHQLILLPRDHQKSRMIAYRAAWEITRRPDVKILYISATARLAEKQLKFIKDILTCPIYRYYWPEMVNPNEGERERWTNSEIAVDHPRRKEEAVRDPTVFVSGLTTNIAGLHCDIAILDDVVVYENAYTEEGRNQVETQYSFLSSIEGTDEEEWVVGTHYHPKDLYVKLKAMAEDIYDEDGNIIDEEPVYEVFERQVEDRGDGTGTFIWPRQQRSDGRWFGFDTKILATKRAKYLDHSQFRAQYYNDPNDVTDSPIPRDRFQYYDKKFLNRVSGIWYFKGDRLNVYASMDFAYSLTKRADYTALVVIGIDPSSNVYVLDIERIKTDRVSDYFNLILDMHVKWDFRKLRAEVTGAQKSIVKELKYTYLQPQGLSLSIEENSPSRHEGSKEERIQAILQPRYDNLTIWHYQGGECHNLEEELTLRRPPHDDIKDALASAIEIAIPPVQTHSRKGDYSTEGNVIYHKRFGGVAI
jgi:hypothetical protein